jgi:hypothetical protein
MARNNPSGPRVNSSDPEDDVEGLRRDDRRVVPNQRSVLLLPGERWGRDGTRLSRNSRGRFDDVNRSVAAADIFVIITGLGWRVE